MPVTPETPESPLLAETNSLLAETEQAPEQIPLFSASDPNPLLAETSRTTSASKSDGLHQKVYECPSHGRYYFKYVCSVGHKIAIQRWISGGSVNNRIAQSRAAEVERWINWGVPPDEIDRRIQSWSKRRRPQSEIEQS